MVGGKLANMSGVVAKTNREPLPMTTVPDLPWLSQSRQYGICSGPK
jgi:hypothetical protein